MNKVSKIFKVLFYISLLIYPITFVIALYFGMFVGIDQGWAMPAWSDQELMYGWEAVWSYLIIIVWIFSFLYISVLIFQVGYLIYRLIKKIKSRIL